ncbi:MAG: PIG-L family deacetylase [Sphingobacteriaceae bacterium]|nr:PIG-L family deacetylase [Sphingobacteriaceae bacterium]
MTSCRYIILFFFLLSFSAQSQEFTQLNAAEIKLALQKLNVVGSVLYIAAHPDDENTRLLAYLAKEKKLRTGYLSITRGDGGQNLIGSEQAELLGLIRTQELLAARKIDGAEQFFTRANDFGFSKSAEESLKFWGKEQILEDIVWVIRNFKPDVIITRFPEDARAGHGQHAASAILAREAFVAAADPRRFTSQLAKVQTWQAKRIVWNTSNFGGGNNSTSPEQLKINVGLYNPLLGKSYGEIAAQSRTNHKSQAFGSASQRGDFTEFFNHTAGSRAQADLFEDINLTWDKFKGGKIISVLISQTEKQFDANAPYKSIKPLLKIKRLIEETGQTIKFAEADALILACAGIWFEMNSIEPYYAIGDSIPVHLQAISRLPKDFKHQIAISESLSNQRDIILEPNKGISINSKILFSKKLISQPYWLRSQNALGYYSVDNPDEIGLSENKALFSAHFTVRIGDQEIKVSRPVVYKYTDQVRGEVYQHIAIAPPVTATLSDKGYIFDGNKAQKISVQLQSFSDNTSGILHPQVPAGWVISPKSINFNIPRKGSIETREFNITPGQSSGGNLVINIKVGDQTFQQGFREIKYDHIPAQVLFPRAEARLEKLDIKTTGKKIGYIAGAGDLVAESLKQIGYEVTNLSTEQVSTANLSSFDAIVTGVRLYNTNQQVKMMQARLLDYVSKGGVLLVQYNVNTNLLLSNIGPYPFKLSRDRVSEETAEVGFVNPEHRILNYPNKITEKDFEGWVQERGLYFTSEADPAYSQILSMNDTGEKANTGSLLVSDFGKGKFVYTSLSFFRQLPAGVPGAYRLFVNLLSK